MTRKVSTPRGASGSWGPGTGRAPGHQEVDLVVSTGGGLDIDADNNGSTNRIGGARTGKPAFLPYPMASWLARLKGVFSTTPITTLDDRYIDDLGNLYADELDNHYLVVAGP
jgi:hypothetical protein